MKVLMIGGNGNISWYCTKNLIEHGIEVYELHRGITYKTRRDIPCEAKIIHADIRQVEDCERTLSDMHFDVVCDFICYNKEHASNAIRLFSGKTRQYIFISSDVLYERRIDNIPFCETARIRNKTGSSDYILGKIEAEEVFWKAYKETGFPVTVVRPGYTYDTIVPVSIGHNCWTAIDKIQQGYPLLIGGDGNAIWNMTHSRDFACAFCGLVGNVDSIGEAFDISTDDWITWNDASEILLEALHIDKGNVFHVPFERALHNPEFQPEDMNYDRMWHAFRTNQKIHQFVPKYKAVISLEEGIRMSLDWLLEKQQRRRIVQRYSDMLDHLYDEYDIKV